MCVCVCVCVCERERERERNLEGFLKMSLEKVLKDGEGGSHSREEVYDEHSQPRCWGASWLEEGLDCEDR